MNDDVATPVTMAELEQSDPRLASQVRRARRRAEAENIMNLARAAQEQTVQDQAPPRQVPAAREEPEPIWR
jgi:type II secretory pathway pseudopilin PulG